VAAASIAGYPLHWEADVLLADGGVAHLRPSGPADTEAIRGLHGRSSAETLYMRYFSAGCGGGDRHPGRHRRARCGCQARSLGRNAWV